MIFCTQLTFDLFLRLRNNYRLGIHPYVSCQISRNNISMGRIMYSILPSKVKISVFFPMGLPTSTYRLCEQQRFRRACASAQSRQNLRYSLIQAVNQEEPSDRKPDPWPLWMTGHAELNLSWRNARRHKFAWRGPNGNYGKGMISSDIQVRVREGMHLILVQE